MKNFLIANKPFMPCVKIIQFRILVNVTQYMSAQSFLFLSKAKCFD